ncbi:MAG: DNA translocase FtsK [Bacillota bacterium]|nr:DNA translocase FtsK [Bacillota bacterium]
MSWIQELFQKFKKVDEEKFDHLENNTINTESEFYSENKKIEAKIAYQYPKGKFRFPLIPDEVHQKTPLEENKNKSFVKEKKNNSVVDKKNTENVNKKPNPSTRIIRSGPFRPTEIPSPIFGFSRPEPEIIEHELSNFTQETQELKEKECNVESSTTIFSTDKQPEMKLSPFPSDMEMENVENEISQYKEREDLHNSVIPLSENENLVSFSEEITVNDDSFIEETEQFTSEIEEDYLQSIEKELEQVERVNEETLHDIIDNPIQENLEKGKTERSHLPFNVIMLKQDRQRWEQKRSDIEKETNETKEIKPPQTNSMIISASNSQIGAYELPNLDLLKPPVTESLDDNWVRTQEEQLNQTLENFNVGARVVNVTQGPSVTRFEVHPEPGVKVNKVTNLTDDIKLSLAARDIRIEAPIPGKHTIGIEVPNLKSRPVLIREIIQSHVFLQAESPLTAVLGLDISGKPIITDLKKMPHGLIAGATGSGKSVCINSILISLLYKASPEDLKLLLIDPKMVELAPYNRIPHLVSPVITDVKAATSALKWAVDEMERRYELFAHTGVRDINRFNELAMMNKQYSDKLPFIVIVIDELADLMMMSPADVEEAICRIAQKARACGIHLIIATQRPSVDVITGLIKANIPTRVAFSVSSQVDSRTIIDISGAEKLLGRGDMLFLENGSSKPVRLQGTFVSDEEIDFVVGHVRDQREPEYLFEQEELLKKAQISEEEDELFYEACEFVVDQGGASTSSLQRRFKIGYNRAARLMDLMEGHGYISGSNGSKPREVLIKESDLESMQSSSTI